MFNMRDSYGLYLKMKFNFKDGSGKKLQAYICCNIQSTIHFLI